MTDTTIMPFGKYKGKMLGEIPAEYMIWLHDEFLDENGLYRKNGMFAKELADYLRENLEYYKQQLGKK